MGKPSKGKLLRMRRKKRIRKRITGTTGRPRLSVFRSSKHMYAQVIDDSEGKTLVSVCSYEKGQKSKSAIEQCQALGKTLAERCKAKNVETIVFDKNGFSFHGRVKALAEGAREGGLIF
jgi:large subunit ribosomal protein L18